MTFRLPQGSLVTYDPDQGVWHPEWLGVDDDRDLPPYRTLIRQVQALPWSPTRAVLEETAAGAGAHLVRWSRPPRAAPATLPPALPPPLPRPPKADHGSLTGYLRRTPEARQAIRAALTQPLPRPPEAPLVCPPLGANPGLVGTAFDYALRFMVQGLNPHLLPVRGRLVARLAALDLDRERVRAEVNAAEGTLREVADGLPFEERHARAAVVLASYEVVARTGLFHDLAGAVPPAAWQDVLAMIQAVPTGAFRA